MNGVLTKTQNEIRVWYLIIDKRKNFRFSVSNVRVENGFGNRLDNYNNTFTKKILLSIRWTSKLLASGTENYNKHLHQQENESTLAPLCNVEQQASLHKMFQN
jgi:hypothetical protein